MLSMQLILLYTSGNYFMQCVKEMFESVWYIGVEDSHKLSLFFLYNWMFFDIKHSTKLILSFINHVTNFVEVLIHVQLRFQIERYKRLYIYSPIQYLVHSATVFSFVCLWVFCQKAIWNDFVPRILYVNLLISSKHHG